MPTPRYSTQTVDADGSDIQDALNRTFDNWRLVAITPDATRPGQVVLVFEKVAPNAAVTMRAHKDADVLRTLADELDRTEWRYLLRKVSELLLAQRNTGERFESGKLIAFGDPSWLVATADFLDRVVIAAANSEG